MTPDDPKRLVDDSPMNSWQWVAVGMTAFLNALGVSVRCQII